MKAIQLIAHGKPGKLELRDLPDPRPAANEVVLRVHACGLNRLDLWVEEGVLPIRVELPITTGGEIAGEVVALGSDVEQWRVGDRVAVQPNVFCGECEFCRRGEEAICLHGKSLGVQLNGGFAERIVLAGRALARLPDAVDYETSAALILAGSTAMHMLTDRAEVHAGDWVLVIGASSGVGSAAIQIAKQLGARVITTASSEAKRELAIKLGAEHVVDSTQEDWPAAVRKITDKRGVDLVVEHVGGEVLQQVFNCVVRGGTVVTCGATAGRDVTMNVWPFFVKQQRLIGSYGRNRADLTATLEWAASGKLKPAIDRLLPLEETASGYLALRQRAVLGKVVIKP